MHFDNELYEVPLASPAPILDVLNGITGRLEQINKRLVRVETRLVGLIEAHDLDYSNLPSREGRPR